MKWFKCCLCNEKKDEQSFYNDKSKPSGKKPRCKSCDKTSLNKEARREYEKKYREENKEKRAAIVKKSMSKNIEHHKEQRRRYLKTDGGRTMYRKQTQKRYAIRKAAFVEDVDVMSLFLEQSGVCYLCGGAFEFKDMECDHVRPLAKGGLHEKSNCKMACSSCNRSKGAKLLEELSYQMV
jgi:5-methylcytosine-specific restriction endonuclease McrA